MQSPFHSQDLLPQSPLVACLLVKATFIASQPGERAFRNDLRSIKEGVGQLKEEIGRLGKGDEIDLLKSNNGKVGIKGEEELIYLCSVALSIR